MGTNARKARQQPTSIAYLQSDSQLQRKEPRCVTTSATQTEELLPTIASIQALAADGWVRTTAIAETHGVKPSTVRRWRTSKTFPNAAVLEQFGALFWNERLISDWRRPEGPTAKIWRDISTALQDLRDTEPASMREGECPMQ